MDLADQRQIDVTAWVDPQWLVRDFFHAEYPDLDLVVRPKYVVRLLFAVGRGRGSWNLFGRCQQACWQQEDDTEVFGSRPFVHLNVAGACTLSICFSEV